MRPALVLPPLVAACVAPDPVTAHAPRPAEDTPVIVISSGTSEWGYSLTEVFATDVVTNVTSGGIGQGAEMRSDTVPGAYARVAAVLRRQGPGTVRATGRGGAPCPGSRDTIAAVPPVGAFASLDAPCGGPSERFRALFSATTGAIAPPR
jgi:hypothetical protein